jgi:hypothetical protein
LDAETNGQAIEDDEAEDNEDDSGSVSGPAENAPNGTADEAATGSSIERPEQTVASEVVKSGSDDVSRKFEVKLLSGVY